MKMLLRCQLSSTGSGQDSPVGFSDVHLGSIKNRKFLKCLTIINYSRQILYYGVSCSFMDRR